MRSKFTGVRSSPAPAMQKKISVIAVLFAFTSGIASAAAWCDVHQSTGDDELHHSHGSSCPDPGGGEEPCGPTCACTCCPGHVLATAAVAAVPSVPASSSKTRDVPIDRNLNPQDVRSRVFHPPRV